MEYGRTVRCVLREIAKWLGTGTLIAISVSWSFAAFAPLRPTEVRVHSAAFAGGMMTCYEHLGAGWRRRECHVENFGAQSGPPPFPCVELSNSSRRIVVGGFAHWPSWGRLEFARTNPETHPGEVELATGWPFVSLWCELGVDRSTEPETVVSPGGILLGPTTVSASPSDYAPRRSLPLRPVWGGLAMAALVWSCVAFMTSKAATGIRRTARTRAGQCPRCGYDLRGNFTPGCPECGWNRSTSSPPHPCALQ